MSDLEGGMACGNYGDGKGTRVICRSNFWCKCASGLPPGCTCTHDDEDLELLMATPIHEWGHCFQNLWTEEYCSIKQPEGTCPWPNPNKCGHSVMGDSGWPSHYGGVDFCDGVNGGEDSEYFCCDPQNGHPTSVDNWPKLTAARPGTPTKNPTRTPDPFAKTGLMEHGEKPVDGLIYFYEH